MVTLREVEVEHFVGLGLGANYSKQVVFLFSVPIAESWHLLQDKRKSFEGCFV